MEACLHDTEFALYASGIYQGKVIFTETQVLFATVDARRRTQMQVNKLPDNHPYNLPLHEIHRGLGVLARTEWTGTDILTASGQRYEQHVRYEATVAGEDVVSQVWARRDATAVDIVTVDGNVIAFVAPNRYGMEVLVKTGLESLTPLTVYDNPDLSPPTFGIDDFGTFLVPMRDGVQLATDVYLPEPAIDAKLKRSRSAAASGHSESAPARSERWQSAAAPSESAQIPAARSESSRPSGAPNHPAKYPTILIRTCYDRKGKKDALMRWANKGYAVVVQDVRGRSDSEGELIPFYYERDDGSDTIDWIAAQPWSNGDVGMWGASYLGYVVVAAATSGNPHLKAVVDEVNVGSPFVDTVRRGGTVCSWPLLCWTLAQSVSNRTDFDVFAGITVDPVKAVDIRPIRDIPQQTIGRVSGPWELWSQHPEYDEFWEKCTFRTFGQHVSVPMFVISGWYDGDSAGVSETWQMLTEHDVPSRKIWLGPWEHNPNRARDFEGQHFSNDAVVYDYDVRVQKWFDRFLKGIPNGIDEEPRATYYVVGENRWHSSADWTPVESTVTPFYLASGGHANSRNGDGVLVSEALGDGGARDSDDRAKSDTPPDRLDSGIGMNQTVPHARDIAAVDKFVYNPLQPFDDSGEREPEVLNSYELRNDILVYTSAPIKQPLTVAGELRAEIYAASSCMDTDWVVTLTDVDEQGNSIRLSSYIVRAKYRYGYAQPELLTPNQVERYDIFLPNLAHTFQAGHSLRLSITSSSKMVAFPNTNTGINPYLNPTPLVATQTIYHTTDYPSRVWLPILGQS